MAVRHQKLRQIERTRTLTSDPRGKPVDHAER